MKKPAWLRVRIDSELIKRFKIICLKNDLSMQHQTSQLIRHFVDVQEENIKIMGKS